MKVRTYVFNVEIISFSPMDESGLIDVDHDTYEFEAVDEESAIALLKERFNYSSNFLKQTVSQYRLLGAIEDETF